MITIATTGLEDYLEGGKGFIKTLIAGMPGAGKTRGSGFWPRPIYGSTEGGLMSVADLRVPYVDIKSRDDMFEFLDMLEAECRKPKEQRRWETAVIDTLDAWQRTIIQQYLRSKRKDRMEGFEDWGWLDAQMQGVTQRLNALPMHVVLLVHVKEKKANKKDGDIDRFQLKLQGDTREQIPADFDFVGMIDTDWGVVEGQPGVVRKIVWESRPWAEWLKSRGGALDETPLTFSPSDFEVIRDRIKAKMDSLVPATTIETANYPQSDPGATPMPPGPGGPVGNAGMPQPTLPMAPPPAAARPASPAPTAPPSPPAGTPQQATQQPALQQQPPRPAPAAVPPAPPTAPPPPVSRPAAPAVVTQEVQQTMEQGVATIQETLGGTVVSDTAATQNGAPVPPEQQPQTPVSAPAVAEIPAAPDPEPATAYDGTVPNDAENFTVPCGSPRYTGAKPKHPDAGCGKALTVSLVSGRVTGAQEGENPELIEITGLREQAFLHNACYGQIPRA